MSLRIKKQLLKYGVVQEFLKTIILAHVIDKVQSHEYSADSFTISEQFEGFNSSDGCEISGCNCGKHRYKPQPHARAHHGSRCGLKLFAAVVVIAVAVLCIFSNSPRPASVDEVPGDSLMRPFHAASRKTVSVVKTKNRFNTGATGTFRNSSKANFSANSTPASIYWSNRNCSLLNISFGAGHVNCSPASDLKNSMSYFANTSALDNSSTSHFHMSSNSTNAHSFLILRCICLQVTFVSFVVVEVMKMLVSIP